MEKKETGIKGLVKLIPRVFKDERGYFLESYNKKTFLELGIEKEFVQDNHSVSQKGVLRGLHFQFPPFAQAKLIRVVRGSIIDIAVDIRKGSETYGQYHKFELNDENNHLACIPEGFAHGFIALEDNTVIHYKCSNFYNKESEGGIIWNDPEIGIDWGIDNPLLSERDQYWKGFNQFKDKEVIW